MTRSLASLLLVAVCLAQAATTLADLKIEYTVEEKPLKAAVSGTLLSVELFTDPGCVTSLGTAPLPIDAVDFIERLKLFTPKGGVKPPKTARLIETFPFTLPDLSALYIIVTGTGIVPAGTACQVQYSSIGGTSLPCAEQIGDEVYFEGCNVNIRNGSSFTGSQNGRGNLVIGYNDDDGFPGPNDRSGSHNLVIGDDHAYISHSGLVAGSGNAILDADATALGVGNTASGPASTVTGGRSNTASGPYSSVSGGLANEAGANFANDASISGGGYNVAALHGAAISGGDCNYAGPLPAPACTSQLGGYAAVSGGSQNSASGQHAAVTGGLGNIASGDNSSVSGGASSTASGVQASISGGFSNEARGLSSAVLGGQCNVAGAGPKKTGCGGLMGPAVSTVTGGFQNLASANHSSVSGGNDNIASGGSSVVSSGNGTTQATGFGWSAGAFGSLVTGKFSSP